MLALDSRSKKMIVEAILKELNGPLELISAAKTF